MICISITSKIFLFSIERIRKKLHYEPSEDEKMQIQSLNLEKKLNLKDYLDEDLKHESKSPTKNVEMCEKKIKKEEKNEDFSLKENTINNSSRLKVNLFLYIKLKIKSFFKCNLTEEEKNLEFLEIEFRKQFEILNLLKKIMKLESLQNIVLDEKQKKIFDFLYQQKTDIKSFRDEKMSENENTFTHIEDIKVILNEIDKKEKKSALDFNLLKTLSPQRRRLRGIALGMKMVSRSSGVLSIGEELKVTYK